MRSSGVADPSRGLRRMASPCRVAPVPPLWVLLAAIVPSLMSAAPIPYPLFIGTYGRSAGAGIYRVTFDPSSGSLSEPTRIVDLVRPSFLCYSPDNRFLYSISQDDDSIAAFAADQAIGRLDELNRQPLGVAGACYVGTDATGRTLVAISYGEGAVIAFPIQSDGRLGPRSGLFRHQGNGPHPRRQEKAHAHSATFSPDNRFVYVCDLGIDRVLAYRLTDAAAGRLEPAPESDGITPPGSGPRHAKLTADGHFLYVLNELIGSVSVFNREAATGALTLIETVSSLQPGFTGENGSSEIRLHPSERFVYAANRGPDDLAVFARDSASGRLQAIQHIPSGGGHPRNFAVSPDGEWLVCANRDANNLVVFSIDPATGALRPTGQTVTVPEPVCVLFPNR